MKSRNDNRSGHFLMHFNFQIKFKTTSTASSHNSHQTNLRHSVPSPSILLEFRRRQRHATKKKRS